MGEPIWGRQIAVSDNYTANIKNKDYMYLQKDTHYAPLQLKKHLQKNMYTSPLLKKQIRLTAVCMFVGVWNYFGKIIH